MAERAEVAAVYGAGVVQGVALVTFPAASAVFTSPQYYNLSSTQSLFCNASPYRAALRMGLGNALICNIICMERTFLVRPSAQSRVTGENNGLRARRHLQLAEDVGDVIAHRLRA
jgi:hypothetical protein